VFVAAIADGQKAFQTAEDAARSRQLLLMFLPNAKTAKQDPVIFVALKASSFPISESIS
jgi:hypothetical protein